MKKNTSLEELLNKKEAHGMGSSFATPYERLLWLSNAYQSGQVDILECEIHLTDMEETADDWKTGLAAIRIPPDLFPELKDQFMNTYHGLDYLKASIAEFRHFLEKSDPKFEQAAFTYAVEAQQYFEMALESARLLLESHPAA